MDTPVAPSRYKKPHAYPGYGACAGCGSVTYLLDDEDRWCPPCRAREGLAPLTTGPYLKWYEQMSPEEYQEIMSRKWEIKRFREYDGKAKMPDKHGSVIKVAYPKVEGGRLDLMVGKCIPHNTHGTIFYHRFEQTGEFGGEGSQAHHLTNCPCPVDTLLIEYLREAKIDWVYCYDVDSETIWKAEVAAIAEAPIMEYARKTVRRRYFLGEEGWAGKMTRVLEKRDRQNVWLKRGESRILFVPFIPERQTIVLQPKDAF